MRPFELPPMPTGVSVAATLRNDAPVAELEFVDVTGDARVIQLSPEIALDLMIQLAKFYHQIHGNTDPLRSILRGRAT